MKLELSLLELNNLHVASSRYATQCADELKEYGKNVSSITYFKNELHKAEALRDKIQVALYDECERLDEAKITHENIPNHIDEEVNVDEYVEGTTEDRDYRAFDNYANSISEAKASIGMGNL